MSPGGGTAVLLLAVIAVCELFGLLTARVSGAESVVDQLHDLQSYIQQLEVIEEEERLQGLTGRDSVTVEDDAVLEACDLMTRDEIQVENDDDFLELVRADLTNWDECLRKWEARSALADWKFETDLTEENEKSLTNVELEMSSFLTDLARNAKQYLVHPKYSSLNMDLQRQVRLLAFNTQPHSEQDAKDLIETQSRLEETYGEAKVLGYNLEPDLEKVMAESRDSQALLAAWVGWRNATGPVMKADYKELVRLLNIGATDNGFSNFADAWMAEQFDETDNVEEMAEQLWQEIKPLYEQLHAYIRNKLAKVYPEYNHIFKKGGIPAHLTGNMWAQNWENIFDLVKPYPEVEEPDYSKELVAQGYTVESIFQMAEEFYKSIGLFPMSDEFKESSMKVRPEGKEVVCHASAHDFYSKKPDKDFRIKMCTEINMDSFETVHHEMGHIEYFMAYQDQPTVYRQGANSAFHEAVGDTISLSVRSKEHLKTIGLAKDDHTESKRDLRKRLQTLLRTFEVDKHEINYLLQRALFKIAFLPFGYMIDKWRWDVFRGTIAEQNYNEEWWNLRLKYQGLVSPVPRSEADFDPGAKYHIPSNSPYICYFVSFIVQFQFYESMCKASGYQGPLHQCDFYNSKEAGQKLLSMLQLGNSKPWPEAMEQLTGSKIINSSAILEYFRPLSEWLERENGLNGVTIGWKHATINWKSED